MTSIVDGPQLQYAPINTALTGDNTIIAGVPGKAIIVWKLINVVGAVTNLTVKDGASSPQTGPIPLVANGSLTVPFDGVPWFRTSAGNALIFNSSGTTVQQSGVVGYTLSPSP